MGNDWYSKDIERTVINYEYIINEIINTALVLGRAMSLFLVIWLSENINVIIIQYQSANLKMCMQPIDSLCVFHLSIFIRYRNRYDYYVNIYLIIKFILSLMITHSLYMEYIHSLLSLCLVSSLYHQHQPHSFTTLKKEGIPFNSKMDPYVKVTVGS